jgi:preprotein translocase subunit Sss1
VVLHGMVRKARATLLDHPSMVAEIYERMIDQFGMRHAKRWLGIKINVDRKPTRDELTEMARRSGLGVIWIDL